MIDGELVGLEQSFQRTGGLLGTAGLEGVFLSIDSKCRVVWCV